MTEVRILLIVVVVLNVCSFALFSIDKLQAKRNKSRLPEIALILSMVYMGAVGGLLAMLGFRHKIKKWYFWVALPMLIFSNYLVFDFFRSLIK